MKNLFLPLLLPTLITLSTPSAAQLHKDNDLSKEIGHVLAVGDFNGDGYKDQAIGVPDAVADQSADGSGVRAGVVHVTYGNSQGLGTWLNQYWHQESAPGVPGANEDGDQFGAALAVGDFNGDGYHDLAIGCPGEDIGYIKDAGAVVILYGSWLGLSSAVGHSFYQLRSDVADTSEPYDKFGFSLAAGNFDNDSLVSGGCDDLAVGVPFEDIDGTPDVGMIHVLTGTPNGLTSKQSDRFLPPHYWDEVYGRVSQNFGWALASGKLNAGGYTDLVVTAPWMPMKPLCWQCLPPDPAGEQLVAAGRAYILKGSSVGLKLTNITLSQERPLASHTYGFEFESEQRHDRYAGPNEFFGLSVACGDFDGDGVDDVAIGSPYEAEGSFYSDDPDTPFFAGAINIFLMEPSYQMSIRSTEFKTQDSPAIPGKSEYFDLWGLSLCVGDLDDDGADELIVGAPREDIYSTEAAGYATVFFGGVGFLSDIRALHQNTPGVPGVCEADDEFAGGLSAGDFDGDGRAELSVGVPGEDIGTLQTGFVQVFDISSNRQITWSQNLKEQ